MSQKILQGEVISKGMAYDIQRKARMKLLQLNNAKTLDDLRVPPSNRLEKLSGDRKESYSIRVNNQWRICFVFEDGHFHKVELVDYH